MLLCFLVVNQQRFNRELEANASRWMRDFNDTYVVKIRQITDAEWQYATNLTTQNADKVMLKYQVYVIEYCTIRYGVFFATYYYHFTSS